MTSTITTKSETESLALIVAELKELTSIHKATVKRLGANVKVQGFRSGTAPLPILEKNIDSSMLQSEFLQAAIELLFEKLVRTEKLKIVTQPTITLKKFVPYTTLEFEMSIETLGKIVLPKLDGLKAKKEVKKIGVKDIDEVIKQLREQQSVRNDVDRPGKTGDQVWIDFVGTETKSGEPIKGGSGENYPLMLGSNTFIPGFEDALTGLAKGDVKDFNVTFPNDYGVASMQGLDATFKATIVNVQEVVLPELTDEFAAKIGPFKSVENLKSDIERELKTRADIDASAAYEADLVRDLTEKTKLTIPAGLVAEQLQRTQSNFMQNLADRGQTMQEYLESQKLTEEDFMLKELKPEAEKRVKTSLVLAEVVNVLGLNVTNDELETHVSELKARYAGDQKLQDQLNSPEGTSELRARMLTDKAVAAIVSAQA
jgi:trigger factor